MMHPYSRSAIESVAGPAFNITTETWQFEKHPNKLVRHQNNRAVHWVDTQSGRGGGLESLARSMGLPMPAPEPNGRLTGFARVWRGK